MRQAKNRDPVRGIRKDPSAIYTCPMHPEIRQAGFGNCSLCGMALEPALVTADAGESPEERDLTRRFWIGLALTVPVFLIAMAEMIPALGPLLSGPGRRFVWIQFFLTTPVVLYCGWPILLRGWESVVTRSLNMFTLIGVGTGVAYLYSTLAALAPGLFPPASREGGEVPVYFETAAVIVVLVLLGQVMELRARARTRGALRALLDLAPPTARIVERDGSEHDVSLDRVARGDRLRVRPGDRVPVDGELLEGSTHIDESMVTGEATPVRREAGSAVIGGTLNGAGTFVMRADRVGAETLLAQIVDLVAEAQRSRAPIQRVADLVASWFVPAVLAAAALTALVWGLLGPEPRLAHALLAAIAVLIIACPCALGLATPMSVMVGAGRGASAGVLIRNAEALEILEKADTLVIDKTGTLTEGHPRLTRVEPVGPHDEDGLLGAVASIERGSEHPLAKAILEEAAARGLPLHPVERFEAVPGRGVLGSIGERAVAIGNRALLQQIGLGSEVDVLERRAAALRGQGETVLFVAIDRRPAGLLGVTDPIKSSTPVAI